MRDLPAFAYCLLFLLARELIIHKMTLDTAPIKNQNFVSFILFHVGQFFDEIIESDPLKVNESVS